MLRALRVVHAVLVVATALLFQTLYLASGNTLHDNGRWLSSKVDLQYGILGTVAFLTTRTALHRDRLDLGVWHRYQEVLYRDPVRLASLEADVRLGEPGYLVVLFEHTGEGFQGVRLSRDADHPSACLAGTGEGGFTRRAPLDPGPLDDAWHRIALVAEAGSYAVTLDGRAVGRCGAPGAQPGRVGFRGSRARKIQVDDAVIRTAGGAQVVEDFANHRHAHAAFALALLGVLAVHGGVLAASARSRRRTGLGPQPYLLTTHLVLLACGGLGWTVDALVLRRQHPEHVDFRGHVTTIESKREVVARLRASTPRPKPGDVYRILALGGSQTWGMGARRTEETWFRRLEALLGADAPPGLRYEVVSAGIPAYKAPWLYELYTREWIGLEPDCVLLNVGHNDDDMEALAASLRAFAAFDRARGIRTVLVPEANSTDSRASLHEIEARQEVVRRVAAEEDLPLIEMQEPLERRKDEGFLWWDRVHLTSFGQRLLAEQIFAERATLLGRGAF